MQSIYSWAHQTLCTYTHTYRELDINRLTPENGDYEIDLQEGKRFGDKRDVAEERFFVQVKRELMRRPTFSSFLALLVCVDVYWEWSRLWE